MTRSPRAMVVLAALVGGCGAPVGHSAPPTTTTAATPSTGTPPMPTAAPGPPPSPSSDAWCTTRRYRIVDLGPALVSAIDGAGRVIGATCPNSTDPTRACHAAVFTPGSGWASISEPVGAHSSIAVGVDARGDVAVNVTFGAGWNFGSPSYLRAYTGPPLHPVPTDAAGPPYPQDNVVEAVHLVTGHMVGYDQALGGAFLYDGLTVTPIAARAGASSSDGGRSEAMALNRRDQVVGWMRAASVDPLHPNAIAPQHAFFWDGVDAHDLGTIGACGSEAVAINDAGLVTGVVDVGERCGVPQVFVWDGRMHVLGCPAGTSSCWPFAMNARGDIVGNALRDVLTPQRAFVHCGAAFAWLDERIDEPEGWTLEYAVAIDDAGDIAGWGQLDGAARAFLLSARSD